MLIKVAAVQYPLGQKLTLEDKLFIIRRRPEIICLPEYYFLNPDNSDMEAAADRADEHLAWLEKTSSDLSTTIVGGTMIIRTEYGLTNTAVIYSHGKLIGSHAKLHLYGHEPQRGLVAGRELKTFSAGGAKVGVLICADVLNPMSFKQLQKEDVEVIFVPTTSPFRPRDTVFEKRLRDNSIFVRGAQLANAFVVKAGGVGRLFGHQLQGRSGIFAPWGILAQTAARDENRKRVLINLLDLDEIREFKEKMVFPHHPPPVPAD